MPKEMSLMVSMTARAVAMVHEVMHLHVVALVVPLVMTPSPPSPPR